MVNRLVVFLVIIFALSFQDAVAQEKKSYTVSYYTSGVDTVMFVVLDPITVVSKQRRPRFYRNLTRLKKAIIISYPVAKHAEVTLYEMRQKIELMDDEREIKKYVNKVETELKNMYTPVLKTMTFYQGAVLLKLIDRQTSESGYVLLKELRSGFSAFFWQTLARMYGANLKLKYDPYGDDLVMEQLVLHYERELGIVPIQYEQKAKQDI